MLARLRPLVWPIVFVALAAVIYHTKIQREMADFEVYRTAAERARHAEPLYRESDGHYQFKYLPAFALAMMPFTLVDSGGAKAIWFGMSAGLLTAFVRWSVRGLPERRRREPVLAALTTLFMIKFYAHELTLGQTNIVLGALLVGSLLAAQIDARRAAGALVGLAVFIKPYAIVLLPWLLCSVSAAAGVAALAVVAAGLVLPALVYGWAGNLALLMDWYRTVTGTTAANLLGADNISLAAMWAKWLGPGSTATALATITGGALVGLIAIAWMRRRAVSSPVYLEGALIMLAIPLLSPQGWDYVLLLGTPAVVCLLDRWHDVSTPWRFVTAVSLTLMGLTLFDVMGRRAYGDFMGLAIVTVAALAAAAALVHLRAKQLA